MYELKIILEGNNYLINDNKSMDAIDGYKVEITGDGTLNIDSKRSGIIADQVLIKNTNVNVKSEKSSISSSSVYNYDLIVNNSNIMIESNVTNIDKEPGL